MNVNLCPANCGEVTEVVDMHTFKELVLSHSRWISCICSHQQHLSTKSMREKDKWFWQQWLRRMKEQHSKQRDEWRSERKVGKERKETVQGDDGTP